MTAGLVLDTSAILSYTAGSEFVGERIAKTADQGLEVVVPALCLSQAYREADSEQWHYLDVLSTLPQTVVAPVELNMCAIMGGWSRMLKTMDLAQTAMEAAARPIVPIMSAHADLIHQVLPKEWPIIEL
ncbi:hypothetical protein [Catenuloplanes japonicus]|uniref:hypothetical protein n=1 Tax=Catenuloplanes japonicus TaxID=33876 RepID=UPI000525DBCB|nr:hypothetical protein [Catenuloplanes japonicus]